MSNGKILPIIKTNIYPIFLDSFQSKERRMSKAQDLFKKAIQELEMGKQYSPYPFYALTGRRQGGLQEDFYIVSHENQPTTTNGLVQRIQELIPKYPTFSIVDFTNNSKTLEDAYEKLGEIYVLKRIQITE
jgi:hypothetical protein